MVVLIAPQPNGTHIVSWTYARRVPHTAVRQQLERLSQWNGHAITQLSIADDTLKQNPKPNELFTVASFVSSGLVDLKEGTLNLTPIARACADLRVLHIYVLLPQPVKYAGYFQYATPHLEMWTEAQPTMWRSILYIHTADPAVLEIPLKRPEPKPQAAVPPQPSRPSSGLIALIIFTALLVGVGVYFAATKLLKRQTPPTSVQPETEP